MDAIYYILCCYFFNFISYPIAGMVLNWKYPKFNQYNSQRRNYIIKNYVKCMILKYISISTIPFTILFLFDIGDHTNYIHFIGSLYCTCDTIALIKDIKLSKSTKIHHSITTFFSFINISINWYQANPILKLMALYTTLSCYSFSVNYCLGMRFLLSETEQQSIKQKATRTYSLTCFVNWTIHLLYLYNNIYTISLPGKLYYCLIAFIVYDDIILLKWLNN